MSESERPGAPVLSGGQPPKPARDPVRRWTVIVAVVLLLLLALQIASDRTAPVTAIATVEGLVLPISPRIQGELLARGGAATTRRSSRARCSPRSTPPRSGSRSKRPRRSSSASGNPSAPRPPKSPRRRRSSPRRRRY